MIIQVRDLIIYRIVKMKTFSRFRAGYASEMKRIPKIILCSLRVNVQGQWGQSIWNVSNNGSKAKKFKEQEKLFPLSSGKTWSASCAKKDFQQKSNYEIKKSLQFQITIYQSTRLTSRHTIYLWKAFQAIPLKQCM